MSRSTLIAVCMGALMTMSASSVFAKEAITSDMMPMSKALNSLQTKGFNVVKKIEFEDGVYEAKILNAVGKEIKVKMNAKTGEIEKPKEGLALLSALEIAKKVEDAGYRNISKIDTEGKEYEVKALSKEGKETKLLVNAQSGEITVK
ncbi:PepSY domain-containing protein [Candidatus Berkiella aquae]|uniref:PepSY domain-containing protein n=1 Tax=Candidatus Berkiella aquae TaxID=295108 RepID=A0A0Q9YIJ7_9GAMM|nr:PepSY domain-containing protein [Candidatus Berkiella aquae]MCS5712206.1 PepSY domain-containing protein [Candidatus Berkiella aquae]